jgi:hypothetical protein
MYKVLITRKEDETSLLKNGLAIYIPLLMNNFTLFSKMIFALRTIYLDCRNTPEFAGADPGFQVRGAHL